MTIVVGVVLLVVGAALLTAGAEAFTEHVTAAAARLGVSVLALGVLLAGAEPEEAVTAMIASAQGHPALAAGNAVGANLVILTLTLGLGAVLAPLRLGRRAQQYALAATVAAAASWLLMRNGVLGRGAGLVLLLLYVGGVAWVWRRERQPPVIGELAERVESEAAQPGAAQPGAAQPGAAESGAAESERESVSGPAEPRPDPEPGRGQGTGDSGRPLLIVLLGAVGMVLGGALAVRGADGLVAGLGLRESVVGLTLLGLATSAEMVALVWSARRRGLSELVVAGAVGAAAYNATVTLGLAAVVRPLGLGRGNVILDVAAATALLPLVLVVAGRWGVLPRAGGALLVAAYVLVVGLLLAR